MIVILITICYISFILVKLQMVFVTLFDSRRLDMEDFYEILHLMLIVFMLMCTLNIGFFLGWYVKYSNRPLEPFEVTAIILSMLSIITSIAVLYAG